MPEFMLLAGQPAAPSSPARMVNVRPELTSAHGPMFKESSEGPVRHNWFGPAARIGATSPMAEAIAMSACSVEDA